MRPFSHLSSSRWSSARAIGWLFGSREAAGAKQTVDSLRLQLDEVVKERDANRDAVNEARGARRRRRSSARRAFEARIKELIEAKEALSAQFAEISNKLLAEAQETFLKRADQRFRQSEENAGQNLKALLQPVHDRLERYETTVQKVEAERRDAFGLLSGQIEAMRTGTERVSAEAAKLVNALRNAPKARGRWGEQQLRNVLESCGLSEHCDFATEVSVADGEGGRLRPDVVVRVPGGQSPGDRRQSLAQRLSGRVRSGRRGRARRRTSRRMRSRSARTCNTLGAKAYWAQFDDAPDYVVMFIPGEHFLTAALEQDPTLWDYAFDKKVLLATPTNLIAIARTVAAVWRQERLAKEARQIGELGKELYERLAKAADDLAQGRQRPRDRGQQLQQLRRQALRARSLVTARKFRELNIEPGRRDIDVLTPVEALPRYADEELGLSEMTQEPPQIAAE